MRKRKKSHGVNEITGTQSCSRTLWQPGLLLWLLQFLCSHHCCSQSLLPHARKAALPHVWVSPSSSAFSEFLGVFIQTSKLYTLLACKSCYFPLTPLPLLIFRRLSWYFQATPPLTPGWGGNWNSSNWVRYLWQVLLHSSKCRSSCYQQSLDLLVPFCHPSLTRCQLS